eukprot:CAMPEP_0206155600 /NCGR_PEP_ID=MMETSP1474-20131121/2228_1 /ASSEMBLY_ACC=CAM_ASM_001110 /TAXON_ID=97495 /ORGANISM="Imantonia sp., Strain RCC918" /LENGTH=233 /DNA_ID=CAMNT_0053554307 /DNA_START=1 /DNA_END=703 /DNA_ORIENTATION=-
MRPVQLAPPSTQWQHVWSGCATPPSGVLLLEGLEVALAPAAAEDEAEGAHLHLQELQQLRLVAVQGVALLAHLVAAEQRHDAHVELGGEAQLAQVWLHVVREAVEGTLLEDDVLRGFEARARVLAHLGLLERLPDAVQRLVREDDPCLVPLEHRGDLGEPVAVLLRRRATERGGQQLRAPEEDSAVPQLARTFFSAAFRMLSQEKTYSASNLSTHSRTSSTIDSFRARPFFCV